MGLRGPKPVKVERLKEEAGRWAAFLFLLRDGVPPEITRIKPGAPKKGFIALSGRAASEFILIYYPNYHPLPEAADNGWGIIPALAPPARVWQQLKNSLLPAEISRACPKITSWLKRDGGAARMRLSGLLPTLNPEEFVRALSQHAGQLLIGKRLPAYAKEDWPTSDDKRIVHLARVLAGAELGLAPITAAKRLSYSRWPSDWYRHVPESRGRLFIPSARSKTVPERRKK